MKLCKSNLLKLETARNNYSNKAKNPLLNLTLLDAPSEIETYNNQTSNKSSDQNGSAENSISLNNTSKSLQKSIEKGNEPKIEINRDYKLTNKTTFSLWYDYLISEVKSCNLFDIIDPSTRIIFIYLYLLN